MQESFLAKFLYQSSSKTFPYRNSELEETKLLLLALTGVASINIDGTTIHTGLNIPVGCFGKHLPPLSNKMGSILRNGLSEVKVIIIDEVLMVFNDLLLHIHLRMAEIFASKGKLSFVGITTIAAGDFYNCHQLELDQFTLNIKALDIIWIHFGGFLK